MIFILPPPFQNNIVKICGHVKQPPDLKFHVFKSSTAASAKKAVIRANTDRLNIFFQINACLHGFAYSASAMLSTLWALNDGVQQTTVTLDVAVWLNSDKQKTPSIVR
jgi:hypothetical protein